MKKVAWRHARIGVFHDEFQIFWVSRKRTIRTDITTASASASASGMGMVVVMVADSAEDTGIAVNVTTRDTWRKQS